MRRVALLAAAVIVYMVAAWMVAPGFYDGFGPPLPYNWTCPPPQAGSNQKPSSGHVDIKVIGGVSDANSVFTNDSQIVLGFLPGAFDAAAAGAVAAPMPPSRQASEARAVSRRRRGERSMALPSIRWTELAARAQDFWTVVQPSAWTYVRGDARRQLCAPPTIGRGR